MHSEKRQSLLRQLASNVSKLVRGTFPTELCDAQVTSDIERVALEPELQRVQEAFASKCWTEIQPGALPKPLDSVLLLTDSAFTKVFPAYIHAVAVADVGFTNDERQEVCEIIRCSIPSQTNQ